MFIFCIYCRAFILDFDLVFIEEHCKTTWTEGVDPQNKLLKYILESFLNIELTGHNPRPYRHRHP